MYFLKMVRLIKMFINNYYILNSNEVIIYYIIYPITHKQNNFFINVQLLLYKINKIQYNVNE